MFTERVVSFTVPLTYAYVSGATEAVKKMGYTRADGQFTFYPGDEDGVICVDFLPTRRDLIFKKF